MTLVNSSRQALWCTFAGISFLSALGYALSFPNFDDWTFLRTIFFGTMGLGMMGVLFVSPQWKSNHREFIYLLCLAALLRLALLPTPPSDDIHRYLWEGKLVTEGISPYSLRGDHPDLSQYRDEQWAKMNNKDKLTAYPPGSLLVFATIGKIAYTPLAFKIVFALLDLVVICLILYLLKKRRLPLRNVSLYAFNPVILVAIAGEGHLDVLMLVGLAATAVFIDRKAWLWVGCCLAIATQMKFMALLGLPFIIWNGRIKAAIGFVLTTTVMCLPFAAGLPQLFDGLYQFGALRDFNGLPNLFGNLFDLTRENLRRPLQVLFMFSFAWIWLRHKGRDDWHSHWLWICGSLLILSPTVHFWYLSWIAISLVFAPSLFWISLCLTQAFYFLVWKDYAETGTWDLLDRHSFLIWTPVFVFAIPYALRLIKPRPSDSGQASNHCPNDDSVLVVVPTLNAASTIKSCLTSILPQLRLHDKIILSDADSTDSTIAIAQKLGVSNVSSPRGRGTQIFNGLLASPSRFALIVHADSRLRPQSIQTMIGHLQQNPNVVGGSLGQAFSANGIFPYRLIEWLNEIRAVTWGISFGDQCQFFDRSKFPNKRFPSQPLMEDIELSLRLREIGPLSYLGIESQTNPGKWKKQAPLRILLVLSLVAKYLIQRSFSEERAQNLSHRLYQLYYGKS
ncbi:glycosyltransferase [Puniceicoccaceae bacterium K14]|nr:glycosyltransferase [Puniceicoccaceae bacterium K14]